MKYVITLVIFIILQGCQTVTPTPCMLAIQNVQNLANADREAEAIEATRGCAQMGCPECYTLMGELAFHNHKQDEAIRWFTLAARWGQTHAISRLVEIGAPIPDADYQRRTIENNRQNQKRADEGYRMLYDWGQKTLDRNRQPPVINPNIGAGMTCFYKSDWVSGMNKNCVYDCMGNTAVQTFGSASICPLSIQR